MALHTITVLGAPWPSGASVGDVIELEAVPAWAVGKCEPAPDGAEATVAVEPPTEVIEIGSGEPAPDGAEAAPARKRKA